MAKKKSEEPDKKPETKGRTDIDPLKPFVAASQAAQGAVEKFEDPEQILERFGAEVIERCRRLKRHQSYFLERRINPFQRLQIICQQNTLHLQDNFDKIAGMKAEESR
jgi:hypothetical protein